MEAKTLGLITWGWKVAAYLFLAGVGAGAYVFGVATDITNPDWTVVSKTGVMLGAPLVFIGTLFLIWDLERPKRLLKVIKNIKTSWISRGTIILSVFMVLGAINIAFWIWPFSWLEDARSIRLTLELTNMVFAILTMVYTGVLLGASRPIPFWSTPILPLLFLVSALSTGIMAIILSIFAYTPANPPSEQILWLSKNDIILIFLEAAIIIFYLQASHATLASRASVTIITKGRLALHFWLGVIALGLLLPLALESILLVYPEVDQASLIAASAFGLIGGLMLRVVVIFGGVKAPLNITHIFVFQTS